MYLINLKLVFIIVTFIISLGIVSGDHFGNIPVFEHGTVETSSTEDKKGSDFDYSSIHITESPDTSFRPIVKPVSEDVQHTKYVKTKNGEKINLMKTYFDPITKQAYRYVMRKRPQPYSMEDDSIFNAASKFISKLLGTYEQNAPHTTPELGGVNNGPPTMRDQRSLRPRHFIHKREIFDKEDNSKNTTHWAPVYMISNHQADLVEPDEINTKTEHIKNKIKLITNSYNYIKEVNKINDDKIQPKAEKRMALDVNESIQENLINNSENSIKENDENKIEEMDTAIDEPSGFMQSIKILQKVFMNCKHKLSDKNKGISNMILSMQSCVQTSVMKAVDRMMLVKEIPLSDYIYLVRNDNALQDKTKTWNPLGKDLKGNSDFVGAVCERMFKMLQTHSLQFRLWDSPVEEGRRRHHYRKAFPMMVAGYMMLSAFLVPLGFQFMAMIGGKALLLSKMALMMSMLGGFKKLLTPDQIYHSLPSYDAGWHHRSTQEQPSMTLAYTKNKHGTYNTVQRDYTNNQNYDWQHWIDPKSYNVN